MLVKKYDEPNPSGGKNGTRLYGQSVHFPNAHMIIS
jgi:hypothetical protein